ncbi:hypothetical protein SDC9_201560 [bioreactor metagenome]|uniref:Uncharacterized protein n=1 Tax=bioreactor metagenome TaxID=1076179 RepID=A0A645ISU9_9ZZZZ
MTLIDPAPAVARHLYKIARERQLIDPDWKDNLLSVNIYRSCYSNTTFYSSDGTDVLKRLARGVIPEIPVNCFVSDRLN